MSIIDQGFIEYFKTIKMKKVKNLGKDLNKSEQKSIKGGDSHIYVCIESLPFIYYVNQGQLCNDGSVPLCA